MIQIMNQTPTVIKKGRGRPKGSLNKVKNGIPISPITNPVSTVNPAGIVKRGRGRPKKVVENVNQSESDESFKNFEEATGNGIENAGKRRRGRPKGSKNGSEEPSIFVRESKKVMDSGGWIVHRTVFKDVPTEHRISQDLVAKGTRVLVAQYPDFYRIYFKKYHEVGEGYPHGGIEVYSANNGRTEFYYYESVALHPKGGSIRMVDEVNDAGESTGEVKPEGYVPSSGSDEKIQRKLARREKKMAKEAARQAKKDARQAKKDAKENKKRLRLEKRSAKEAKKVARIAKKAKKLEKLKKQKKKTKKFIKD